MLLKSIKWKISVKAKRIGQTGEIRIRTDTMGKLIESSINAKLLNQRWNCSHISPWTRLFSIKLFRCNYLEKHVHQNCMNCMHDLLIVYRKTNYLEKCYGFCLGFAAFAWITLTDCVKIRDLTWKTFKWIINQKVCKKSSMKAAKFLSTAHVKSPDMKHPFKNKKRWGEGQYLLGRSIQEWPK